jgi:hypothetical protein
MQLALDPPGCGELWADGAHTCARDERHAGPHRCDCGKTRKASPKKKPRARKPSKTKLKAIADKLAGDRCRSLGYCQAAGNDRYNCGGNLQWAHVETRRNLRLRWEVLGALCLCAGHHRVYSNQPTAWVDFLEANFPEHIAFVRAHRHEYFDGDYQALIASLKEAAPLSGLQGLQDGSAPK